MPFPTEVVVCPACGTQNRIRKDLPHVQFRCGTCHRPIVRPTRFDQALDDVPALLLRGGRQLLEILILAIPLWIGWDSIQPKEEPAKQTKPYAAATITPTPTPPLQSSLSFEERRAAAIAALPSPQLAPTPAATLSPEAEERWKSPEWQAFWVSPQAQAIINRLDEPAHERAKELRALYLATHKAKPTPTPFSQHEESLPANGR